MDTDVEGGRGSEPELPRDGAFTDTRGGVGGPEVEDRGKRDDRKEDEGSTIEAWEGMGVRNEGRCVCGTVRNATLRNGTERFKHKTWGRAPPKTL